MSHSTDITVAVATKALDGLFLRQMTIAQNIANAGTPDFQPVRVSFEAALAAQLTSASTSDAETLARIQQTQPEIALSPSTSLIEFRPDLEISHSAENSMRYQMLIGMLDKTLQFSSMAMNPVSGGAQS